MIIIGIVVSNGKRERERERERERAKVDNNLPTLRSNPLKTMLFSN
jgi:hypothetical protein